MGSDAIRVCYLQLGALGIQFSQAELLLFKDDEVLHE